MNLIINGFSGNGQSQIIEGIIKHSKCQYFELISDNTPSTPIPFKRYSPIKINRGIEDYQYDDPCHPLDQTIIQQMYECEAIFYKIAERLEKNYPISYHERKRLYYRHLEYWNDVIERHNIACFIASNIPHEGYDFIIYHLCKTRGIPTLFFHQVFPGMVVSLVDWEHSALYLKERYKKLKLSLTSKSLNSIDLGKACQLEYAKQTGQSDPTPFYMKKPQGSKLKLLWAKISGFSHRFGKFIKSIHTRSRERSYFRRKAYSLIYGSIIARFHFFLLKRYVRSNSGRPDYSLKYIYFPLHYQPELTTAPMGGAFANQELALKMLSYHLPDDITIYVKEHPAQKKCSRSYSFYQEISKLEKVQFVYQGTNSYDLIDHAWAVATITGTAGWEALFRNKPVIMFGSQFYQYADNVFRVRTNEDCAEAIRRIIDGNYEKDNSKNMKIFMKALEEVSTNAAIDELYLPHSAINLDDSNMNMLDAAIRLIDEYANPAAHS